MLYTAEAGSGKGSLEAMPRADGTGPCSGSPKESSAFSVQVGWLGPLKRVENTPRSTLLRAFSSQTYAKSADPNLTNNPRPHHARFETRSPH